jgi:hypothetical protein
VLVTVLNSHDRDADSSALLDWAFGTYRWDPISPRTAATLRMMQRLGQGDALLRSFAVCG